MRRWQRATLRGMCGGCGSTIPVDAVVTVITLPGVRAPMLRCATCEGGAPPELPREPVLDEPEGAAPARLGLLPLDWRRKREREPGEEG